MTTRFVSRSPWWPWFGAAGLYTLLALAYCWPLLGGLSTRLPSDIGDPGLNAWILWWNTQAVPLTERWWNAPIFFPTPDAFAYSETLLGLSLLTTPFQWAGAGAVEAYNVAFVASFALCAMSAHALGYRLTGRHDAALVAGLAFGFHPYRAAQISHLQMLWAMWMPLGLLALHRYLDDRRLRSLAYFGVCWSLNALSCGYYLVFFAVLVALWMVWFVRERRDWVALTATVTAASVPVFPLIAGYASRLGAVGAIRGRDEIESMSADLSSFWAASPHLTLAGVWTLEPGPENELYLGTVVLGLVLVAGWAAWIAAGRWWPTVRRAWFATGVIALSAASVVWLTGGFETTAFGVPVSVTRPHRLVGIGIWLLIIAFTGDERLMSGWRRRSVFLFYAVAAAVMLAFALGPVARVFDVRFMDRAPYFWLMQLPGGESLRVPARFTMLAALCLAQAAAIGWSRIVARARRPALAAVAALLLADGWVFHLRTADTPGLFNLPDDEPGAVVFEIPTRTTYDDSAAMIRATHHGRGLVNGYSGYFPGYYGALQEAVMALDETVFDAVRGFGPLLVVVDASRDPDQAYARMARRLPGARRVRQTAIGPAYLVPATARPTPPSPGPALPIVSVETSRNPEDAEALIDGRLDTRWDSDRPQEPGEEIRLRLSTVAVVSRIEIDLGGVERCYPRRLRVSVGSGDQIPRVVWEGPLGGAAVLAAYFNPRQGPLAVPLPEPVPADVVVLTSIGRDPEEPWSAAEIRVIGTR